jgi:CheY-like chemotaxis protein
MNPISGETKSLPVVLVVDDCRMTRRLLSMYLRASGLDVVVAENGVEALEMLGRESCGLVITDLNMPQMDGIELTREIKEHPLYAHIPVVMLTTQGEARERECGLGAGVSTFLTKPISQEVLIQEINRVWPQEDRTVEPSPVSEIR